MAHCISALIAASALVGWAAPTTAVEALVVIYDNGQAQPIAPFLSPLRDSANRERPRTFDPPNMGAADLERLLPIESDGLTPGKIVRRQHAFPFARPFFMVGSDAASQQWLVHYRQHLIEIGAVGLLVHAATVDDLTRMAATAEGLSLNPASGADIARALGIAHYPVALSGGYVWQ